MRQFVKADQIKDITGKVSTGGLPIAFLISEYYPYLLSSTFICFITVNRKNSKIIWALTTVAIFSFYSSIAPYSHLGKLWSEVCNRKMEFLL